MIHKLLVALLVTFLLAVASRSSAQQAKNIPRIGYISGTGSAANPGPYVEELRHGLAALGYVDGKDFVIEFRGAAGKQEPIAGLVGELVRLKVDVLVLPMVAAIRAAKEATKTIPIIMVSQIDPVSERLIESLARPGGNITGLATLQRDLSGKRLELLKEAVPKLGRVGILRDADESMSATGYKDYESAARALKLELQSLTVRGSTPDIEGAFRTGIKTGTRALIAITNGPIFYNSKRITELAIKHRWPSMFEGSAWVDAGGMMSYSANDMQQFRRAATFVDKILKGAKPADLPVEQPTKFEFVINLKTAKALNLNIPQSVLFRADRVIK